MKFVTSGDVKKQALADGVPDERVDELIRRWHAKKQYLDPDQAYQAVLVQEKNLAYGNHPGQIPKRDKGSSLVASKGATKGV